MKDVDCQTALHLATMDGHLMACRYYCILSAAGRLVRANEYRSISVDCTYKLAVNVWTVTAGVPTEGSACRRAHGDSCPSNVSQELSTPIC